MKRIIGFIMFWIAVGMIIMMFIDSFVLSICLIVFRLILGYHFFCCK